MRRHGFFTKLLLGTAAGAAGRRFVRADGFEGAAATTMRVVAKPVAVQAKGAEDFA